MMQENGEFFTSVYYVVISFIGWNSVTFSYLLLAAIAFRNVSVSNRIVKSLWLVSSFLVAMGKF